MRSFALLASLGMVLPALALPTYPRTAPSLFSKDPLSIHKRAAIPADIQIRGSTSSSTASSATNSNNKKYENTLPIVEASTSRPSSAIVEDSAIEQEELLEDACSDVCGITTITGAHNEKEALCSVQGLRMTLECAQCIDLAWPETSWQDSALAEYERIVLSCEDAPQVTYSHQTL